MDCGADVVCNAGMDVMCERFSLSDGSRRPSSRFGAPFAADCHGFLIVELQNVLIGMILWWIVGSVYCMCIGYV